MDNNVEKPPVILEKEKKREEISNRSPHLIKEGFIYELGKVGAEFYIENPDALKDILDESEIIKKVLEDNKSIEMLNELSAKLEVFKDNIVIKINESAEQLGADEKVSFKKLSNLEKLYSILGNDEEAEKYKNRKEKIKASFEDEIKSI